MLRPVLVTAAMLECAKIREWPEGVLLEGVQHFEKNKIQGVTAC